MQYPPGWRWSSEVEGEAIMQGVSRADLGEHVEFWTTHKWNIPVTDLDGELRRNLSSIRKRAERERAKEHAHALPRAGPRGAGERINRLIERANAMGDDE